MVDLEYNTFYDKKTNFENIQELKLRLNDENLEDIIGLNLILKCLEIDNFLEYNNGRDTYIRTINSLHVSLGLSHILDKLKKLNSNKIINSLETKINKQEFKEFNNSRIPVLYEVVRNYNKNQNDFGRKIINAFNKKKFNDFKKILFYYNINLEENKELKFKFDRFIAESLYKEEEIIRRAIFNPEL
jgi:predicted nucleic-acid-binding protein